MFQLPPDISYQQEPVPNGFAFNFRHAKLGDLGRILLQERPDGQTQILCEIVGDFAPKGRGKGKGKGEKVFY